MKAAMATEPIKLPVKLSPQDLTSGAGSVYTLGRVRKGLRAQTHTQHQRACVSKPGVC